MLEKIFYKFSLRVITIIYLFVLFVLNSIPLKNKKRRQKLEILATGTFYSNNWLTTHLLPLALSDEVHSVRMVATQTVPEMDKVTALYPPLFLQKIIGEVPSRLLYFSFVAIKTKPDVLAGFHLLLNGMQSILLARLLRVKSIYICGGGPSEVLGGGYTTENKLFGKLTEPDKFIESMLINTVNNADLIITMGTGAGDYFRSHSVKRSIEIVPGGFDGKVFTPKDVDKKYDLILIGRLSDVKRVDVFLETIKLLKDRCPTITAVIVGNGPDSNKLNELSKTLGLDDCVTFAGWQNNIEKWLTESKIFVLTSESEGLSQALIQAMMTGLPAVVHDVGDLSDLVKNDVNGYLVKMLNKKKFSEALYQLLNNKNKYQQLSKQAYLETRIYNYDEVKKHWDSILKLF